MNTNYDCDYQDENCTGEHSEIRILPLAGGANIHVCKNHFRKEMLFRQQRNMDQFMRVYWKDAETLKQELKLGAFDLPKWEGLEVYNPQ